MTQNQPQVIQRSNWSVPKWIGWRINGAVLCAAQWMSAFMRCLATPAGHGQSRGSCGSIYSCWKCSMLGFVWVSILKSGGLMGDKNWPELPIYMNTMEPFSFIQMATCSSFILDPPSFFWPVRGSHVSTQPAFSGSWRSTLADLVAWWARSFPVRRRRRAWRSGGAVVKWMDAG